MRTIFTCFLFSLSFFSQASPDGEFAVHHIPAKLMENVNVVVRLDETRFEIISTRETRKLSRYVITILNENGDDFAEFEEYYYKFRQIESLDGILYDASGKVLKKVRKKEFQDLSGVDAGTLMDDIRFKRHNFHCKTYPHSIEYTTDIVSKGTMFFPMWVPQPKERVAVQSSSFQIVSPEDYVFRTKTFNYNGTPEVRSEKKKKISRWYVENMHALEQESYSPAWHELSTVVLFGPTDFQLDDFKGNMSNWNEFGKFTWALNQGKDNLPESVKQTVHQLTDELTDSVEKISRLYNYLQRNTRYVSIQLGVGGWQPFDASFVAVKGYGDCKALTNYMYSLLKEAGITSYYTLIRAGRNARYITEDFPSQQFNHVILCVPLHNDTIWLECTSQIVPTGYLGDFTADRYALMISENGGMLVHTPAYSVKENQQVRKIVGTLNTNGNLVLNTKSLYRANRQEDIHQMISQLSREKVREYLHERFDFATYDISSFDYKDDKSRIPTIEEDLGIDISNYATFSGRRLFLMPNVMTRSYRNPELNEKRKYPIHLSNEFTEIDTVIIDLPGGYTTESIPTSINLETKFGNYSSHVEITSKQVKYFRKLELYKGVFPASDYKELVSFYQSVYKTDRIKVVLVKND